MTRLLAAVLLASALLGAAAASAQPRTGPFATVDTPRVAPPISAEGAPGDTARLDLLRALLDSEARRVSVWTWCWIATLGAITVGQLAPIPFVEDRGLRIDLWVGGVSTFVGALATVVLPLDVQSGAGLPQQRYAALREAERRVREGAANERAGCAWYMHLANAGLSVASALVLGLGFQRWISALINFGAGFALGEAMLLTQPTRLVDAAASYGSESSAPVLAFRVAPTAQPDGLGLTAWLVL